ncbi:MAG TPA: hypothetical protein VFV99_33760 [Kofleriaceae bacterium]|nr:hypothetical protein [Kofleriaceae bacterium]
MRILVAVALAGCYSELATSPNDAPADAVGDSDVSTFAPTWSYTTPDGFTQSPEEDIAITGSLQLGVRGFDQIASATAGTESLRIVPRRASLGPLPLLTEPLNNRVLVWMLEPLGVIWHNPIVWQDGTSDAESRVLYHVVEGGLLDATWSHAVDGTALSIEMTSPAHELATGLYELGALRVRVVTGTATLANRLLIVTPQLGSAQVLVYSDDVYDSAAVDAAGALLTPLPGKVSERSGPVVEKHVRFQSQILGIDHVFGLGDTPSPNASPVLVADRGELYVGSPDGWRISALATKIIKTGPLGMRRMRYARAGSIGGQTFNFYVFSPRGTVTLWPVGRITRPYRISQFGDVTLADFPGTDNDYSEDLPNGTNVMHTHTTWAWDASTLVEASTLEANATLAHTGMEGNSVDGGWRHTATGTLTSFAVGGAQGFAPKTLGPTAYRYDTGDAAFALYSTFSVYHQQRAWSGAWADRPDRVAALQLASTIYFGSIKALHNTDVLPAGSKLTVSQVLHAGDTTDDPAALHARYTLSEPLRDGMLDLDLDAKPQAPWDLAIAGDERGVVFQ